MPGTWEMKAVVPIHRLRGSVLGLVGFGRIPQLVAPKAKSFGMKVIAFDPFVPPDVFTRADVRARRVPGAAPDVRLRVRPHTAVPETRGLFNRDTFGQMKPGSYLVNTARGPIIDEGRWPRRSMPEGSRAPRST